MDADTGAVLYEKDADARSLIASTTKIMTALVALEHCAMEQQVEIPPQATGIEGSSIYLKPGESLQVQTLLYGLMLHSGNDAAIALALLCAGSVEEFAALMNLKAQQLGMKHSHFVNPNGLDDEAHYSTARELAVLTRAALQNPDFAKIVATKQITLEGRTFTNHNRLLWCVKGALGVKTGFTKASGRILVSACEREGRRLIAVTIRDGNDWKDHTALYDEYFSKYIPQQVFLAGDVVCTVPMLDGGSVELLAAEPFSYTLAAGEQVSVRLCNPRLVFRNGSQNTPAGTVSLYLGEKQIGTLRVLWGKTVYDRTITEDTLGVCRCLAPCG